MDERFERFVELLNDEGFKKDMNTELSAKLMAYSEDGFTIPPGRLVEAVSLSCISMMESILIVYHRLVIAGQES